MSVRVKSAIFYQTFRTVKGKEFPNSLVLQLSPLITNKLKQHTKGSLLVEPVIDLKNKLLKLNLQSVKTRQTRKITLATNDWGWVSLSKHFNMIQRRSLHRKRFDVTVKENPVRVQLDITEYLRLFLQK